MPGNGIGFFLWAGGVPTYEAEQESNSLGGLAEKMNNGIADLLPVTCSHLPEGFFWPGQADSIDSMLKVMEAVDSPPYIYDLARVEWATRRVAGEESPAPLDFDCSEVNPTLELLAVGWRGLPALLAGEKTVVEPDELHVAVFNGYDGPRLRVLELSGYDLLAIKIIAEELKLRRVAETGGVSVGTVQGMLADAGRKGLIYRPPSRLQRELLTPGADEGTAQFGTRVEVFTLQWHLTQKCDLRCRHCYDRSGREEMSIQETESVLDQLYEFCEQHRVAGQVSFSGGNPLLYPHFDHVYRETVERGLKTAILGNPTPREQLEKLLAVRRPEFFQVSLEGLEEHNDYIRGRGHFKKSIAFLELLRELGIYSMVMLTLTRNNIEEVLPLAEFLRDKTDQFNFNRLSPVGEGAALASVPVKNYREFLEKYWQSAASNPVMRLKDNLFNIIYDEENLALFGGCTGFGCGAAFNFLSLLPDGEVHACRKFPSLIGNIHTSNLGELYHSPKAQQYRVGASGCSGCRIRRFCGGCLAVVQGSGRDPFTDVDPYCFIQP